VREVGARELERASVRDPVLERDHRNDEAGKPEPHDGREQPEDAQKAEQDDRRDKRDHANCGGFGESPPWNRFFGDDSGRERERKTGRSRRKGECERQSHGSRCFREYQSSSGGSNAEGERAPEAAAVEPDRLGHELANGPGLRR
jgi:hypothetical protein